MKTLCIVPGPYNISFNDPKTNPITTKDFLLK